MILLMVRRYHVHPITITSTYSSILFLLD
jgi:hypothetical protein